jgi:L-amino acid N-acyltransferase YncA
MSQTKLEFANTNFKIRDAVRSDIESVHRIFNEILATSTATFEEEPIKIKTWFEVFDTKQLNDIPFLVVETEGVVIGYGTYGAFRKASGYKITVEHSLYLDERFRGQGIGKTILSELIRRASNQGIHNMIAAVDAENLFSIKMHEKFGFKVVGKLENVARKFSRDLSLVLMQLSL